MSNPLTIINRGLIRLGVPPIASLSDAKAQALVATSLYEEIRDVCLSNFHWSFALREVQLAELVIPSGSERWTEFSHTYQKPGDCVRILGLESGAPFKITGDQIHTDDSTCSIYYVSRVVESAWSANFSQYVSFFFAGSTAKALTDDADLAKVMFEEAERARRSARSIDSQQTPPTVLRLMSIYTKRSYNPLMGA